MQLWIDNTTIHSAKRCLEGTAKSEASVSDLLQLATQIVFSSKISISGFETKWFSENTEQIYNLLIEKGMEREVFVIQDLNEKLFSEACLAAAERLSVDLKPAFETSLNKVIEIYDYAMPDLGSAEKIGVDYFHNLIIKGIGEKEKTQLKQSSLAERPPRAHEFMLASSDELWEQVHSLSSIIDWKTIHTWHLLLWMRYYLNEELATRNLSYYAPSIARSRALGRQSLYLFDKLSSLVGEAAKKLEPELVGAPSIASAIVLRSKGDPQAILEEAIHARVRASDLRSYISSFVKARIEYDSETLHKLRKNIWELGDLLEQELGIKGTPKLRDAIEVQFVGLVPIPSFSIDRLERWLNYRLKRKRINILSEFAKTLANQRLDPYAYDKLMRRCCHS